MHVVSMVKNETYLSTLLEEHIPSEAIQVSREETIRFEILQAAFQPKPIHILLIYPKKYTH